MAEILCKGPPCDTALTCIAEGKCCYRSSADMLYEERQKTIQLENGMEKEEQADGSKGVPEQVVDFSGAVDGKGIKMSMFSTKSGVHMIDPAFVLGIGDVLTYGANKYAKNNWMRGMAWSEVFGAVLRHLCLWFSGQDNDKESGLPHLHHAACSLMFLGFYARRNEHKQFDDRVFGGNDA